MNGLLLFNAVKAYETNHYPTITAVLVVGGATVFAHFPGGGKVVKE